MSNTNALASCLVVAIVLAAGCGDKGAAGANSAKLPNAPTESDARKVFENTKEKYLGGIFELKSFKKVNGKETEYQGTKGYQIDFEAEVLYPQGMNPQCGPDQRRLIICMNVNSDNYVPVGGTKTTKSKVSFQKTEKGWQGGDGKIY